MRRPVLIAVAVIAVVLLATVGITYRTHHRSPSSANCKTSRSDYSTSIKNAAAIQRQSVPDTRGLTGDALAKAPWKPGTPDYDKAVLTKQGRAAAQARFAGYLTREDRHCFTVRERARADTQLGILDSPRNH
ncbi:MAG: hypothetical protein DLM59_08395 [Pseudonocardiales bacterium]|nr:MAG: hypothetical protein DLM59_08395 [Pseudonocardiales bacterium]